MAEQTFKSPGFFEREIEIISKRKFRSTATPAAVIGPASKGPAFVPTTIYRAPGQDPAAEFFAKFGLPDRHRMPAHAAAEFFANGGQALTFCRTLGTGLSSQSGSQTHAGFKVEGTALEGDHISRAQGAVQFLVASHNVNHAEHLTLGMLNDNDSHTLTGFDVDGDNLDAPDDGSAQIVRAMIFLHKSYTMQITSIGGQDSDTNDTAQVDSNGLFDIVIRNINGNAPSGEVARYTVSLDPNSTSYITKVLNVDSFAFTDKLHYLFADFPVDDELASVSTDAEAIAIVRGIDTEMNNFGDFESRYTSPKTTSFISQPFGKTEYDLFHIESLDDGSYASGKYKVSIADLKASTEKNYKYGTFTVQLRAIDDTDSAPEIYESYSRCSLDPSADNFIAKVIGDQKIKLSLDVDSEDEKRLVREGTFPNVSERIRVVVSDAVLKGEAPDEALPFGFRGIPALKTTSNGKDSFTGGTSLLTGRDVPITGGVANEVGLSILPPLPMRMKVTVGDMRQQNQKYFQQFLGHVKDSATGVKLNSENTKTNFYWGMLTSRIKDINNPNSANLKTDFNRCVLSLTKFLSSSSSVQFSDDGADKFNNNKFSLAQVAFPSSEVADIAGTPSDAFLEAVYVRNAYVGSGSYNSITHQIDMNVTNDPFALEAGAKRYRATMAKLLVEDPKKFNKYSSMAKFTAPFVGGFDGLNILNKDDYFMTDRSVSAALASEVVDSVGGHAQALGYESGLSGTTNASMQGASLDNNNVVSYRNAVKLMTDEMIVDNNILVVPGIRESLVTDFAARRVKSYGKSIYLMDIPHLNSDSLQIFTSADGILSGKADVESTSNKFNSRELDSSYVATYFPDVMIIDRGDDENARLTNQRSIRVPSSVVALGALAKTDSSTQSPWFAPAGFSRGSLSAVKSLDVRLNAADRDELYESRINPIANFPNNQFVIFGQKTTQIAHTALDRVNVRRLMINIKRRIQKVAQGLLFEQNDAQTRANFISATSQILQQVRIGQGIEDFRVIMDDSNNTEEDVENNRLNGRIIVVPTRAVEFIAMDFIITNSGVEFPS